jgi:DNA-binding NarL/FixJ family response regulator
MSGTSLASRNEGSAKSAILDFIQRVTTEGPDFVPVSDRVAAAVRAAAVGESVISPELLVRLLGRVQHDGESPRTPLTVREREVLALVAEGLSNAAIADRLVVSVHTVRNHIASLSGKLGAHSKLEALSIALRQGLVSDL